MDFEKLSKTAQEMFQNVIDFFKSIKKDQWIIIGVVTAVVVVLFVLLSNEGIANFLLVLILYAISVGIILALIKGLAGFLIFLIHAGTVIFISTVADGYDGFFILWLVTAIAALGTVTLSLPLMTLRAGVNTSKGGGDLSALKAEVTALKAEVAALSKE